MKNILLFLLFVSVINYSSSQELSDIIDCSPEIGHLKLHKKTSLRKIKKIGEMEIKQVFEWPSKHSYKMRTISFEDTIEIVQRKMKIWHFRYYTTSINLNYPSKLKTHENIQIGISTLDDIITLYGSPIDKSLNSFLYKFPNKISIWFNIYDIEENDEKYNPKLKDKLISIEIY